MAEALEGRPAGRAHLAEAAALVADPGARAGLALAGARFQLIAGEAPEAVALLRSALDGLGPGPSEERLRLEAALITVARSDPSLAEIAREHLDAVRDAAATATPGGRLVAVQLAFAEATAGIDAAHTAATARLALGDGLLLDENPLAPDAYIVPISVLSICDELDEAAGWYERAAARVRERGEPLTYATVQALAAWTALLRGRLGEAEVMARDALRIAAGAPAMSVVEAFAGAHMAAVLRERGDPGTALELTTVALAGGAPAAATGDLLFAHGSALLAQGEAAAALDALLDCGRHQERAGIHNPALLPWRSAAAGAAARLGRECRGGGARRRGGRAGPGLRRGAPLGIALRGRGLLASGADGIDDLEASVAALEGSAAVLELAHSQVALGAALRRSRRRADARRPLADALATAEACGAEPLAEAARTELQATGARRRSGGSYDPDALTVAERRVCEMAAAGMRNREIAQALFVTRGTVESQLHAAYRKLAISSRGQLGEALARVDGGATADPERGVSRAEATIAAARNQIVVPCTHPGLVPEPELRVHPVAGHVAGDPHPVVARRRGDDLPDDARGVVVGVVGIDRRPQVFVDLRLARFAERRDPEVEPRQQQFRGLVAATGQGDGDGPFGRPLGRWTVLRAGDVDPRVLVRFAPEEVRVDDADDHRDDQDRDEEEDGVEDP